MRAPPVVAAARTGVVDRSFAARRGSEGCLHPVARSIGQAHRRDQPARVPGRALDEKERRLGVGSKGGCLDGRSFDRAQLDVAAHEGHVPDQPLVGADGSEIRVEHFRHRSDQEPPVLVQKGPPVRRVQGPHVQHVRLRREIVGFTDPGRRPATLPAKKPVPVLGTHSLHFLPDDRDVENGPPHRGDRNGCAPAAAALEKSLAGEIP